MDCEIRSIPENRPFKNAEEEHFNLGFSSKSSGALCGTMGRYQKTLKKSILAVFCQIRCFPQTPPGQYVALCGTMGCFQKRCEKFIFGNLNLEFSSK